MKSIVENIEELTQYASHLTYKNKYLIKEMFLILIKEKFIKYKINAIFFNLVYLFRVEMGRTC
jgi:hypothetical protein